MIVDFLCNKNIEQFPFYIEEEVSTSTPPPKIDVIDKMRMTELHDTLS